MSTFYTLPVSPNCQGPAILIAECKLPYATKVLDAMKGETRAPAFLAKNPFHTCPTIEEGDLIIWESNAVMRYLCNMHKLDQWFPSSDIDKRAKIEQAMDWRHCVLWGAITKVCLGPLGFAPSNPAKEADGMVELKDALVMLESYYLKDGKFVCGSESPTLADLAIRPALAFLDVVQFKFSPAIAQYMAAFDAKVASYKQVAAPMTAMFAAKGKGEAKGGAKKEKAGKKEKAKKEKKAPQQSKKGKGKKEEVKLDAEGLEEKRVKACFKEGGKKGQDLCGMSTFGVHFFLTAMDEPAGDMRYLHKCMLGANKPVDPDGDDRKGGADDLAKIFFSAGEVNLAVLGHLPAELEDKCSLDAFMAAVLAPLGAKAEACGERLMCANVAADPDANRFPLKMRDAAIAAGFDFLKAKMLVLDDDSDDDINYADAAGVDLNAGPEAEDY